MWHATFTAYDTASAGVGATRNFTNDPAWTFPEPTPPPPPLPPVTPPTLPDPPPYDPPPIDPGPLNPVTPDPLPMPVGARPVVTTSTVLDVGGSGLNAIDFYYSSSPGAEFTNYRLDFQTLDDAGIHDPVPGQQQDAGGDAVDTFMNTIGSLMDLGNATHLYGEYNPNSASGAGPISHIDWDVFDTLPGDTNTMAGGEAPYHMARVLVSPDSVWNATFTAYDTANPGLPTPHKFTNNPNGFVEPLPPQPTIPDPVPIDPDPAIPPPVDPEPPVDPGPIVSPTEPTPP
jgi:hypothetical protein